MENTGLKSAGLRICFEFEMTLGDRVLGAFAWPPHKPGWLLQ
jgi:hypothetical protein